MIDRLHRARRLTGPTINTFLRINVEFPILSLTFRANENRFLRIK